MVASSSLSGVLKINLCIDKIRRFPILTKDQVALVRAEVNTGHLIGESFQLVLNEDQIAYTLIDNLDAAVAAAENLVKNGMIQCVRYGKDRKVVRYVVLPNK